MADESTAVQEPADSGDIGDISLDALNEGQTPEPAESSPAEETSESTDEDEAETTQSDEAADKPTPDADDTDKTETEADTDTDNDGNTVDLKAMSRRERADYFREQRQELQERRQIEQSIDQAYQPQDVDQLRQHYLNEGYTDGEALMLARQDVTDQKAQLAEAKAQIAEFNADLRVDTMEAQAKYDWMNPAKTDVYDKDLHNYAAQLFAQGATIDPRTNQIIDAKQTPSQVADIVNRIYESGVKKASVRAQKAAEQQMAAVAPPSSTRQAVKQGNSLSDIEARLKDVTF